MSKLLVISIGLFFLGMGPATVDAAFPQTGAGFARDAPATIFTQVAYSDEDGMLNVYHILRPGPFFTSDKTGTVYRFRDEATGKGCPRLRPVFLEGEILRDDTPAFAQLGEGLSEADRARRSVTDVLFTQGCPSRKDQPRSEEEILALEADGEIALVPGVDIVNAPTVPSPKARANWELWEGAPDAVNIFDGRVSANSDIANAELQDIVTDANGNPIGLPQLVRSRAKGFAGGKSVWYITYEVCSDATWADTGFCNGDGVKFVFSLRSDSSISETGQANIVGGVPFPKAVLATGKQPKSAGDYSPIWRGLCVGGTWEENSDRIAKYEGTDMPFGPGGASCFGPTPQEIKDFTSSNGITLPMEIFPADDPRHGGQIRSSDDLAALEGMDGFNVTPALWAGKVKIINCPIFASDVNMDRTFSTDEIIAFPNHVLEADRDGIFLLPSSP
ncbi:MAG TPA: hypothetical protein EYN74_04765 [Nitrospirales bacterium]|nr:hypothetical protein [Nitrospirales bacterium]